MSNNIRELRVAKGLSMRELADRMNTHFTTVAKIERSQRRLTYDWVRKFADALEVSPEEIGGGDWGTLPAQVRAIPVIGMVVAGHWQEAVQSADDFIMAPSRGAKTFGLVVEGTSMDKIAQPGSVVLVDPDARDLRDGAYYVIMNEDGETTFKQLRSDPLRLEPCSTDPRHKPIPLGQSPFQVVGRVTGFYTSL